MVTQRSLPVWGAARLVETHGGGNEWLLLVRRLHFASQGLLRDETARFFHPAGILSRGMGGIQGYGAYFVWMILSKIGKLHKTHDAKLASNE